MSNNLLGKLKGFVASAAAVVMAVGMVGAVPVMAAHEQTSNVITIKNSEDGHTYEAYQVFAGTVDETTSRLAGISWGSGIQSSKQTDLANALKADSDTGLSTMADDASAEQVAQAIGNLNLTENAAQAFAIAKVIAKETSGKADYLSNTNYTSTKSGDATEGYTYTIDNNKAGLPDGYYLVKDQDNSLSGEDKAYTAFILRVVGGTTVQVNAKENTPSLEKKVASETNQSTGANSGDWHDAADYNGGEKIAFKLTGTLPTRYADYTTYEYAFHDTLSKGLAFDSTNNGLKVYVLRSDGTTTVEVKSGYTLETTAGAANTQHMQSGESFAVYFTDLNKLYSDDTGTTKISVSASDKIVVEYYATLGKDDTNTVVGGPDGNPNTAYLTYSNNPNGDGSGKSATDKVTVFTFKVKAQKFDSNDQNPLVGVKFYLKNSSGTVVGVGTSVTGGSITFYPATTADQGATYTADEDGGELKLEQGTYTVSEQLTTDQAAKYTAIDDFYLKITATYDGVTSESADPKLTNLQLQVSTDGTTFANSITDVTLTQPNNTSDAGWNNGVVKIVNHPKSSLPVTGGVGTTMFYVIGAAVVAAAAALLIAKKRKNA